jgi:hypothetical protein
MRCPSCGNSFEIAPGNLPDARTVTTAEEPDPAIRCPFCGTEADRRATRGTWQTFKSGPLDEQPRNQPD